MTLNENRPLMTGLMQDIVSNKVTRQCDLEMLSMASMDALERDLLGLGVDPDMWDTSRGRLIKPGKGDPFVHIASGTDLHSTYITRFNVQHGPALGMSQDTPDINYDGPILADLDFTGIHGALNIKDIKRVNTKIPFLIPFEYNRQVAEDARALLIDLTGCLTHSPHGDIIAHQKARSQNNRHSADYYISPVKLLTLLSRAEQPQKYEVHSTADLARLQWHLGEGVEKLKNAPPYINALFKLLVGDGTFDVTLNNSAIYTKHENASFDRIREICGQAILSDHISKLDKLIKSCLRYASTFDVALQKTEYSRHAQIMNRWDLGLFILRASKHHDTSLDNTSLSSGIR